MGVEDGGSERRQERDWEVDVGEDDDANDNQDSRMWAYTNTVRAVLEAGVVTVEDIEVGETLRRVAVAFWREAGSGRCDACLREAEWVKGRSGQRDLERTRGILFGLPFSLPLSLSTASPSV